MDKPPLAEQKEIEEISTKKNKKRNNKYPYITSLGFGYVIRRYVICNHQITLPQYGYGIKGRNKWGKGRSRLQYVFLLY